MAEGFQRFHYNVADQPRDEGARPGARRGVRSVLLGEDDEEPGFPSDEAAARYHLSKLLETDARPGVRGITARERAELVPDLELLDSHELPRTDTRLVRFKQAHAKVEVFGSRAVCELDGDRGIVSAQGEVAEVKGVSPIASVSVADALSRVADLTGTDAAALGAPAHKENFFFDPEPGRWRLVHVFEKVPAAPPELVESAHGHGLGRSPRSLQPLVTYLVDAHDGEVVYYFSAAPLLDVPTMCKGVDESGRTVQFWGSVRAGAYELRDPLHDVATFDLGLGDLDNPVMDGPARCPTADWADTNKAAVSAHVNATRVCRFYNAVLARAGIDNKGMEMVNVVNCTYGRDEPPPVWNNAVWHDDRMWYGQAPDGEGELVSFSRFLDVMAHELTHGLTQYTAGLVYRDESGALNESFSDIFGVIIKNWDEGHEGGGDVSRWDWEIGSGLGRNGLPLRDMSDPTRTGHPDHYANRYQGPRDLGGVHINSNVHNKAAYNILTAADGDGAYVFSPRDVAYLYYYCLLRLTPLASFREALESLVDVATTVYAGSPEERDAKVAAVRGAYAAVGIAREHQEGR